MYFTIYNLEISHTYTNNRLYLLPIRPITGKIVTSPAPWFEDAYFLFTVRIFDPSLSRSNTNPKKIYCIDHALVVFVLSGILVNSGHLLENLVFTALRRLHQEIYYYKTRTGREVDFIVPMRGQPRILVHVYESLTEPQTRKREIAALSEAMTELGLKAGTIVTLNEEERLEAGGGTIEVVPAWRFLLELPESAK